MQTSAAHHPSAIKGPHLQSINSPAGRPTAPWTQAPPPLQSHQSSTVRTSSTLRKEQSESDVSASISELEPPEDEGSRSPPANRPMSTGINGSTPYRPATDPAMPTQPQSSDQIKDQILLRLRELEELDSVRSRARAELMKKRNDRDDEIRAKRIREDEKRWKKRDLEDAVFAKSEQELDYEESELRHQLKRIKRGLPVDAPFPATRTVSFAPAPPSVSPADSRSPFSSQNGPIRFDPFAKEPTYSTPPQVQMNDRRPFAIDVQASQHSGPRPFSGGAQAPPQLPSPLPPASTFAPINRNNAVLAPMNTHPVSGPPKLDTGNRAVSTPINPSHYDAINGPRFQTREHYSPMNPPPFPNRTPVGPVSAPGPIPITGIRTTGTTMTKRGLSTHPYMYSEAFAKRHGNCDRKDSQGRGIWHHEATNTDRYIRCSHDNCGRMDWKTLHGFACHIVRRHDVPKGTLQGIQDALDKYGYEVDQEQSQSKPSASCRIPPNVPVTPITPAPGQTTKRQQSPDDDDESMDGVIYRMQGTPSPYHEELVYSDDSESEDSPKEEARNGTDTEDNSKTGDTNRQSTRSQPIPPGTSPYPSTMQNTVPATASGTTFTESSAHSIPVDPSRSAQFASLPDSDVSLHPTRPPLSLSAALSPAQSALQNAVVLSDTPAPSLDTKLAEEIKKVNNERSQQDSDYVESQTMTPQSPSPATVSEVTRNPGSRPSIAQGRRGSRIAEIRGMASTEPAAMSTVSTTTPSRSPQPSRTARTELESPYKQRVSDEGFAKDAAKRMDKLDQDDDDYTEPQGVGETQTETQTETQPQTETVAETQTEISNTQNPISTEADRSTLDSDQPIPKPIFTLAAAAASSSKKRPTTRDGPDSPSRSPASINKANGFPSKARRIGSRHNSIGKAPMPISLPSATASASSSALSSPAIPRSPVATAAKAAKTVQTGYLQQGSSDTDDTDSIIVTTVRPAPAAPTTTTTVQEDHQSGSAGGRRRRRTAAAAAAGRGWSTLVSRRTGSGAAGESPVKTEREGAIKLEDIPSSPHREKVRRVLRVFSSNGSGSGGGDVVSVKKAVEALAECGGREEDAINALLDAEAGNSKTEKERERAARRRGGR